MTDPVAQLDDPHLWRRTTEGNPIGVPFDVDCIACGRAIRLERYLLKQAGGIEELGLRVITEIPVTCERLAVGDRVRITKGHGEGDLGAIHKVCSPGMYMVAIDGDTPFCAPGEEQWHPRFLISSLERA